MNLYITFLFSVCLKWIDCDFDMPCKFIILFFPLTIAEFTNKQRKQYCIRISNQWLLYYRWEKKKIILGSILSFLHCCGIRSRQNLVIPNYRQSPVAHLNHKKLITYDSRLPPEPCWTPASQDIYRIYSQITPAVLFNICIIFTTHSQIIPRVLLNNCITRHLPHLLPNYPHSPGLQTASLAYWLRHQPPG